MRVRPALARNTSCASALSGCEPSMTTMTSSAVPIARRARATPSASTASVVGRKSPTSLYNPDLAGFDSFASYDSKDAEGFIRMNGLRLSMNKALRRAL